MTQLTPMMSELLDILELSLEAEDRRHDPMFMSLFPECLKRKTMRAVEIQEHQERTIRDALYGYTGQQNSRHRRKAA